jgi:hypothetical protein
MIARTHTSQQTAAYEADEDVWYEDIEEIFTELNGKPRTWWPDLEEQAWQVMQELEGMKELRFE